MAIQTDRHSRHHTQKMQTCLCSKLQLRSLIALVTPCLVTIFEDVQ